MDDVFLKELEKSLKQYKFWGNLYFIMNDYFNGIGTVISIIMPFGLAALLYLPEEETISTINLVLLIIAACGLILTIVRSLFKFPERAKFHKSQFSKCEELKINLLSKQMTIEEAARKIIKIKKRDKNEPLP